MTIRPAYLLRACLKRGRLVHAAEREAFFCADGYALTACGSRVNPDDHYLPGGAAVDCRRCQPRICGSNP